MAEALRCRFASAADVPAVAALVAHSFPGPTRTPEWWDHQLHHPPFGGSPRDTLFVGELGGRLVAALQLHPLRQWIGGQSLPVAGVGTVAIAPTHRQRRLGAVLMAEALRTARARGDVASALYPFRVSFYQKLGYGNAGEVLQYQVPAITLHGYEERAGVTLLEGSEAQHEALELYGEWAKRQNGQLVRNERLWSSLLTNADHALFGWRDEHGVLGGYALVKYRTELPRRDRYLEVEELVWTNPAARRGLYGWLGSLGDQWEQLLIRALPSQRLADWLREPRLPHDSAPSWRLWSPAATVLMGPMFRLVDIPAAFARRTVPADAALAVTLEVSDPCIPENTGRWRLVLEGGRAAVEPATRSSDTLRMDIGTLSRLFIGSLGAAAARDAGLLECERTETLAALDRALALPEAWTFDRF